MTMVAKVAATLDANKRKTSGTKLLLVPLTLLNASDGSDVVSS